MSDNSLVFKKIEENLVFDGFRKILRKKFELPDGSLHDFEIFHGMHEVVVIVAFTEDDKMILVKQFRPGPEKLVLEFAGGASENGENLEQAARRELFEETGFVCGKITETGSYYGGSYSDIVFHAFLAEGCVKKGEQELDPTEFINVEILSIGEYEEYMAKNSLNCQNLTAYFLAQKYINRLTA